MQQEILYFLMGFAIGISIALVLLNRRLKRIKELSLTDELTGLRNARDLQALLSHAGKRPEWQERDHSIVLIDLDNFKQINDSEGYEKGDQVLKAFADHIRRQIRMGDLLFRYKQGDEFALILKAPLAQAEGIMHRIQTKLQKEAPHLPTFGFACSKLNPQATERSIAEMEEALRAQKRSGQSEA